MDRTLLLNMAGGFLARLVNLGASFLIVPLSLGGLGETAYGLFAMVLSATVLFTYADLGLGLAVVNRIAGTSTPADAVPAISRTFFTLAAIGSLIGLIGLGLLLYPAAGETLRAFALALIITATGLPSSLATRILFALNRSFIAHLWTAGGRVAAVGAVGICRWLDAGLDAYLLALLGAPVLCNWIMTWLFFLRQRPDLRPSLLHLHIPALPADLRHGLGFTILQLGLFAETGVDNLLIGTIRGQGSVATYDLMARLFGYIAAFVSIGAFPLWPALRDMIARGERTRARRLHRLAMALAASAAIGVGLPFVSWHADIITLWSGHPYKPDGALAAAMALFALLTSVSTVQGMALNADSAIAFQVKILLALIPVLVVLKAGALAFGSPAVMVLGVCAVHVVRIGLFQRRLERVL